MTIRLYIDPTHGQAHRAWLELRRLAAERTDDVQIELVIVRTVVGSRAAERRLQDWTAAAVTKAPPARVLGLIARDGWTQVSRDLTRAEGRARIAKRLGIEGSVLGDESRQRCIAQSLDRRTLDLQARQREQFSGNLRTGPIFGLSGEASTPGGPHERLIGDDSRLGNLRPAIDVSLQRVLRPEPDEATRRDPTPPRSRFARRAGSYLGLGATIGGPGLPHTLVLFANDEYDGTLQQLLDPALRWSARRPGQLAVQVVARGQGSGAERLRQRLCAARALGYELAYARQLTLSREERERPTEAALAERLDEHALEHPCEDPARDAAGGALPRGAWLDGEPINRSELDRLDVRFDASRSGLADLLWGP